MKTNSKPQNTMPDQSKEIIFNTLNSVHYQTPKSLFDTTPSQEYWLYSDLYNIYQKHPFDLGNMYEHVYQTLDTTPQHNILTQLHQHAIIFNHQYTIQSPHPPHNKIKKYGTDIKLSRYACWCLFKNNPHTIFYALYFMMPGANFKTLTQQTYKFNRIFYRNLLSTAENRLNGVLKTLKLNYQEFKHNIFKTFYGGWCNADIRQSYNLPQNATLGDYMNNTSLYYRATAINNTLYKFTFLPQKSQTYNMLYSLMEQELTIARNTMKTQHGTTPEKDITKIPIQSITSEYNKLKKEFIKQYATTNLWSQK